MEQLGYSPKNLAFDDEGRQKLIKGIKKISHAVKSTLGPRGQTVLIESEQHLNGITVTKDGVTVAKSIDLLDPIENLAVKIMKQAADKTASDAGDGTTTAIVLTEALVNAMYELDNLDELNVTEVLRQLEELCRDLLNTLTKKATKLNKKKLLDVATISANNDKQIGKLISDTYNTVGADGIVTVERSQSSNTYAETTKGFKLDRGYVSNLFINNHKKDECVYDDVYVLVSDAEIGNILTIENPLKKIVGEHKKLLIIAPVTNNVCNTLAANVMKRGVQLCIISPPDFGYRQQELMNDIALSLGATYFSERTGDDLSLITFEDLGHANRIIVGQNSSVIIKGETADEEKVNTRISELTEQIKITPRKPDQDFLLKRIASLAGGIGVIYVGGHTDLEQKEKFDRVDDAVCAVRSALERGILPGGGTALYYLSTQLFTNSKNSDEKNAAIKILKRALRAPLRQILSNAGKDEDYIHTRGSNGTYIDIPFNEGYDVKNEVYGDMLKMGVIDPAKVTTSALANAVSVAITILSTNAIITFARTYEPN